MKTHREFKQRGLVSLALPENCLRDLAADAKPIVAKVGYRLGRWFATLKMAVITAEGKPTRLVAVPRIGIMNTGRPFLVFKKNVDLPVDFLRAGEGYEYLVVVISPMGVAFFRKSLEGKFIGTPPAKVQDILRGEVSGNAAHSQLSNVRFVGPKHNLQSLEAFLAISYGAVCAEEENSLEVTLQAMRYLPIQTIAESGWKEWEAVQRSAQAVGEVCPASTKIAERLLVIATNMGGYDPSDITEDSRGNLNVEAFGTCGAPAESHITEVNCLAAADLQAEAMDAVWEARRAREEAAAAKKGPQKTAAPVPTVTAAPAVPLAAEVPPVVEAAPAAALADEVPSDQDALETDSMVPHGTGEEVQSSDEEKSA